MTLPAWYDEAKANHATYTKLAQKRGKLQDPEDMTVFLALALAGEAGELANKVSKVVRGDNIPFQDIAHEMADVYVYLLHLANHLQMDLDEIATLKTKIVTERVKGLL